MSLVGDGIVHAIGRPFDGFFYCCDMLCAWNSFYSLVVVVVFLFSLFQLILFSFECNARTERKKIYTYILLPSFTISISHCFLVYGLCYVQWIKTSISFKFQHRGVNNTFGKWTKTFNKRNQLVCTIHRTPLILHRSHSFVACNMWPGVCVSVWVPWLGYCFMYFVFSDPTALSKWVSCQLPQRVKITRTWQLTKQMNTIQNENNHLNKNKANATKIPRFHTQYSMDFM